MSATTWAEKQPKDGETVLLCGHILGDGDYAKPCHFLSVDNDREMPFTRPDGTHGRSRWIVVCNDCWINNPRELEPCIRADAVWKGNEPVIKVATQ